ncbi:MAG TPA: 1-deoxy-D-xylulose-5-phosphate reductoisomerase [Thermomicrobiales bacterium]|nr:1-deoxy-D-xylulose-5-phosphate reductoisomerase [Thermomicrobiales bacterium]
MSRIGVAVLGSTGSIGTQTLRVISHLPDRFRVVTLAGGRDTALLEAQVRQFDPEIVVSRAAIDEIAGRRTLPSPEGLIAAATHPAVDIVVAATSGHDAIRATWAAIEAGKTIALANKETIVCAGDLIIPLARQHGVEIRPVDSEHSAIWQSLQSGNQRDLARIILTASGGPFLNTPRKDMATVTVANALAHPNWKMGSKITIDSASMMNKGLEVIEAHHLFNIGYESIEVIIHREQIIHSMAEWNDRSTIAQLSFPDMMLPIQLALTWPDRVEGPCAPIDFSRIRQMSFQQVDPLQFPALDLARQAGIGGRTYPTVLSAADEIAVEAFLNDAIRFVDIASVVESTLAAHEPFAVTGIDAIVEADEWARAKAREIIDRRIGRS